jgi:hypothetical protein
METLTVSTSTNGITRLGTTLTDESASSSSALVKRLCSEPSGLMPSLSGGTSSMTAAKKESTAPSSVTKDAAYHRASYAKRIRLLIASGLVAGITPTSIRKRSPQRILDFALSRPAADAAGEPKEDS